MYVRGMKGVSPGCRKADGRGLLASLSRGPCHVMSVRHGFHSRPPARTLSAWVSTEPRRLAVDEARHSLLRLTVHAGSGRVSLCRAPPARFPRSGRRLAHPLPGGRWLDRWAESFAVAEPLLPSHLQSYTWENGTKRAVCLQQQYISRRTRAVGSLCVRLIPKSRQKWH
jgi:hypothetical protein